MSFGPGDIVLPVDKPEGPTSHDVVARARKALGTRKVGHTGTLDPFASGLLLLCIGRTTRLSQYLTGLDKEYEAVARLGIRTDTLDLDGEAVRESDDWSGLTHARVSEALAALEGPIEQVPPQFSAKKVGGEAMHRRARRGERVALDPVRVHVHEIELLAAELPSVRFRVRCSTGTYVRCLARDLGEALGVGAHLTALRRISVGSFHVESSVGVEAMDDRTRVEAAAITPTSALGHLRAIEVDDEMAERLLHGQRVRVEAEGVGGAVAVCHDGALLAVAELDAGMLRPRKVFAG